MHGQKNITKAATCANCMSFNPSPTLWLQFQPAHYPGRRVSKFTATLSSNTTALVWRTESSSVWRNKSPCNTPRPVNKPWWRTVSMLPLWYQNEERLFPPPPSNIHRFAFETQMHCVYCQVGTADDDDDDHHHHHSSSSSLQAVPGLFRLHGIRLSIFPLVDPRFVCMSQHNNRITWYWSLPIPAAITHNNIILILHTQSHVFYCHTIQSTSCNSLQNVSSLLLQTSFNALNL